MLHRIYTNGVLTFTERKASSVLLLQDKVKLGVTWGPNLRVMAGICMHGCAMMLSNHVRPGGGHDTSNAALQDYLFTASYLLDLSLK